MPIYFIAETGTKYVKIGFTKYRYINDRLSSVQTGNPRKLTVILMIEGDRQQEISLHKHFVDYNVRGEWFRMEGELRDYIRDTITQHRFKPVTIDDKYTLP